MNSAAFRARIIVEDGDTHEIDVWDDELTPLETGQRPGREWVQEHFQNYAQKDLRDLLGLPATGNFEAVVVGTIRGQLGTYDGEWDEDLDLAKVTFQQLPDSWYDSPPGLED